MSRARRRIILSHLRPRPEHTWRLYLIPGKHFIYKVFKQIEKALNYRAELKEKYIIILL